MMTGTPKYQATRFFEPATEALRFLPEGPRILRNYPGASPKLGWVAIQDSATAVTGSINVLDLTTRQNQSIPLPGRPGFFAETTRPGYVLVGLDRKLVCCNLLTGELDDLTIAFDCAENVTINDGLAVDGGVLFGTKHIGLTQPVAALYFFDSATRRVRTLVAGQTCSNGKFLRRDAEGATLYDIDTLPNKAITRYRLDATLEHVLNQSVAIAPDNLPGYPDGMRPAPDGESAVIAFYNPEPVADGVAQQLSLTTGEVLCEWILPGAPRVTCPEFFEDNGVVKILFTTAVEGMPESTRRLVPGSGCLYLADTPFREMPLPPPLVEW